jgi:AraC-like DNA-binding protein
MQEFCWREAQESSGDPRERADVYEQWRNYIARHIFTCTPDKGAAEASRIHARSRSVDGFSIARLGSTTSGKFRMLRNASAIARDCADYYALHLSLRGKVNVSQFGRDQWIQPGSYTLFSSSEPAILSKMGGDETILFLVARDFVDERLPNAEHFCSRPYARQRGLHGLVFETVNAFTKSAWHITDGQFNSSARIIAELVLLALSDSADLLSGERSVRAGNLARVKRIICQRLAEADLKLTDVVSQSQLSRSYVHNLFQDEGRTAWEYLKDERLKRARELLETASPKTTITAVALECGFSNMSHFSTSFKSAFGLRPRDLLRRH